MKINDFYPEYEVVRNDSRCTRCRICEQQCANEVHRYDEAKAQLDAITEQIADKKARRATSEEFLKVLERQDGLVTEFQTNLWCGLVDFVTVYARNDVKITFKNGSEIFVKDFE